MTQWMYDLAAAGPCPIEDEHSVMEVTVLASKVPIHGICELCGAFVPVMVLDPPD